MPEHRVATFWMISNPDPSVMTLEVLSLILKGSLHRPGISMLPNMFFPELLPFNADLIHYLNCLTELSTFSLIPATHTAVYQWTVLSF